MQAVQSAVVLLLDGGGWCPLGKGAWALPLGAEEPSIIATLRWLERLGGTEVCRFLSTRLSVCHSDNTFFGALQVHIVASADVAEQLELCLRECSGTSSCTLNVNILVSPESHTEGEALRFLEQKDIVKGDFLLVCGPVVSNADLRPALQAHAARRAGHRQALMTTLLYQAPLSQHITATGSDQCLLVTDTECQQLLKLEQGSSGGHAAGLGTHILGEHNVVTVSVLLRRSGLSPARCCPELIALHPSFQAVHCDCADPRTHAALPCVHLHIGCLALVERQLRLPKHCWRPHPRRAVRAGAGGQPAHV